MLRKLLCTLCLAGLALPGFAQEQTADLVIYGGTSAGVAAAIQSSRMGKSVVLIEPTQRIGGLTTGGLGQTDIGNKMVIGGIAREFYRGIKQHYQDPDNWEWQEPGDYRSGGQTRNDPNEDTMWTFEPSAALEVMEGMLAAADVQVVYGERLDRDGGVMKTRSIPWRILGIRMESGKVFRGRMFIDATYEGDLMASAGVMFTVGREGNHVYGETLNGVQTQNAQHHQFVSGVDPYIESGNPNSGLLPGLDPTGPGVEGSGDHRVQAYCFRLCITDHPDNRLPWPKPEGYNELEYELLFRNFEAGFDEMPWINSAMPNRKTDINNRTGFSTDYIGQNYDYPEAGYETRERIVERHRRYQQGLMWTLAHHPRVPEYVRNEVSRWGPCKDEFVAGNGWQEQLYIREARRMISDLVMTQHHCQGRQTVSQPVGMAAYTMDSHNVQRYVNEAGHARNEGDVQVGGFPPYPIGYRSIVPSERECANLLVPVCLSASHIAFGSIRMEPVFMVLGQSAATAAAHAIDESMAVQAVDFDKLKARLLEDDQVLAYEGPVRRGAGIEPDSLPGLVLDDNDPLVQRTGFNHISTSIAPFVKIGYRTDGDSGKGGQRIRYQLIAPEDGNYELRTIWSAHPNRASNVPVSILHGADETLRMIDQRKVPSMDGKFEVLKTFQLRKGEAVVVTIRNDRTDGYVIADAVMLVPKGD